VSERNSNPWHSCGKLSHQRLNLVFNSPEQYLKNVCPFFSVLCCPPAIPNNQFASMTDLGLNLYKEKSLFVNFRENAKTNKFSFQPWSVITIISARCSPANPVSVSLILISFLALSACTENSEKFKDKQTCKVSQTLFFVFLRSNCCFFTLLKEKGKFISEIRGFSHWWLWTFAHFL